MPITITQTGVFANSLIPFSHFSSLVDSHLKHVRHTRELEERGILLTNAGFPDEQLELFIRGVCSWGGYAGIAGRILRQNTLVDIRKQFIIATDYLAEVEPDAVCSLAAINQITQLRTPSFASKHLRFLNPAVCPVLDSLVATKLDYKLNRSGYDEYQRNASIIANRLSDLNVPNPMNRNDARWFVADVDMALFAHIRSW